MLRLFEPVGFDGLFGGFLKALSRFRQRTFAVFSPKSNLRSEICSERLPRMRFGEAKGREKVDQDRVKDSDVCANNRARFPAYRAWIVGVQSSSPSARSQFLVEKL